MVTPSQGGACRRVAIFRHDREGITRPPPTISTRTRSRDPLVALATFGIFFSIGLLVTLQTWGAARWRYARRHRAVGDVYISTTGVLQPRGYPAYSGFNLKLTVAEVEPGDPDTLRLQVSSYTEDALTRSSDIRIPVPYGREDEAREVAQQLLGASAARGYEPVRSPH